MDYQASIQHAAEAEARWHLIHLFHLSFSLLSLFIAYSSIQNLVSTTVGEVGYWSLATLYIFFCVSSITVGPFIVALLKPKVALIISSGCYCSFIIANGWPSEYTLLPTAAVLGVGASILWSAQGTYLTQCAMNYSKKRGTTDLKADMGLFNGIFFAIFQMNQIVGNMIAGFVLNKQTPDSEKTLSYIFMGTGCFSVLSFFFLKTSS
jgi:hypothetical protein